MQKQKATLVSNIYVVQLTATCNYSYKSNASGLYQNLHSHMFVHVIQTYIHAYTLTLKIIKINLFKNTVLKMLAVWLAVLWQLMGVVLAMPKVLAHLMFSSRLPGSLWRGLVSPLFLVSHGVMPNAVLSTY